MLGADDPDTLTSMNNLAYAYQDAGRMADALRLQEETCRLMSAKMGPDHRSTLVSLESLARSIAPKAKRQRACRCWKMWSGGAAPSGAPKIPARCKP